MDEQISELSLPCAFALSQVCQVIAGELAAWNAPDFQSLGARFDALPAPASYPEALVAVAVLLQFTTRLGEWIHRRLHDPRDRTDCGFAPRPFTALAYVDPGCPSRWDVRRAFESWSAAYWSDLRAAHVIPIAWSARNRFDSDLRSRIPIGQLARQEGCSVSVFQRRFAVTYGETPARYRTRLRVVDAITLLRDTEWKVEAVARAVGWRSKKDLYRAMKDVSGASPRDVRGLSDSAARAFTTALLGNQGRWAGALRARTEGPRYESPTLIVHGP